MARLTRFQQAQAANMLLQASAQLQAAAPKAAASTARSFGQGHGTAGPSGRSVLNQDPNSPRYGQRFVERVEHLDDGAHIVHDYGDHVIDIGPMKGVSRPLAGQTLPSAATTLRDALSVLANANGIGQAGGPAPAPADRRLFSDPSGGINAPQYGDTYGAINGRPLPYRYGGDRRGSMRGADLRHKGRGTTYGGGGTVRV